MPKCHAPSVSRPKAEEETRGKAAPRPVDRDTAPKVDRHGTHYPPEMLIKHPEGWPDRMPDDG